MFFANDGSALAERRVALVIGNATYQHASVLTNTVNDANAIATLLSNAGFDSIEQHSNLGVVEFKRAVREFADRSANADVAVIYYAGHGLEVGGVNYLIPVDAELKSVLDMDDEAVSLDRLLVATAHVQRLSLIILDACRESPFHPASAMAPATRGVSMGLAGFTPSTPDTLVAFGAKAGSVSLDGDGPNSPFASALVKYIALPGLDIRIALGKVRDEVLRVTANRQEPYVYGSLGGREVALVPAKPAAPIAPPASADSGDLDEALDYRMAERAGSLEAWRAFLTAHSSGFYADLARAQVEKMLSHGRPGSPEPAQASNGRPAGGAPMHPGQPASGPEVAVPTAEEQCRRDEDRLVRLRASLSYEEAQRLESELSCKRLRPQLLRLMESLAAPQSGQPLAGLEHPDNQLENEEGPVETEKALNLNETNWKEIQLRLSMLKFYLGTPNGVIDGPTRSAIAGWQRNRGFGATGFLDETQLTALKKETEIKHDERLLKPPNLDAVGAAASKVSKAIPLESPGRRVTQTKGLAPVRHSPAEGSHSDARAGLQFHLTPVHRSVRRSPPEDPGASAGAEQQFHSSPAETAPAWSAPYTRHMVGQPY